MDKRIALWKKALIKRLPEGWVGNISHMEEMYASVTGRVREQDIQREREKTLNRYLALVLCLILLLPTAVFTGGEKGYLETILRPDYQSPPARLRLVTEGKTGAGKERVSLREEVSVTVQPRTLTEPEKGKLLEETAAVLQTMVLGENNLPGKITSHITLPDFHQETGVQILWNLDEAFCISEDGTIDFLSVEAPKAVTLRARLILEDQEITKVFAWLVYPTRERDVLQQAFARRSQEAARELSASREGNALSLHLPEEDMTVSWSHPERKANILVFPLLFLALAALVYKCRYRGMDRQLKRYREQIDEDIPDMINEFVLLMNAGLVAQSAFKYMADTKGPDEIRPLFLGIQDIVRKVEATNTSFIKEFILFAQRVKSRELMRFTSILSDNISKGSALSEKLEVERELLWAERKKKAEMKAKEAETKLAAPLMLLLGALILITVAPAIMEL